VYHIKFILYTRETKPPPSPPPPPPHITQRRRQIKRKRNPDITQTPPTATSATYFLNFSVERETIEKLSKTGGGRRRGRRLVILRYIFRHPKENSATAAPSLFKKC
jgi:hypothetical protein